MIHGTTHTKTQNATKRGYYLALFLVILVWGLDPLIMSFFYQYYSASALTAMGTLLSSLLFIMLAIPRRSMLHAGYFKVAIPLSVLNSVACLLQKIGLQYTTPANYAFLEHLSCLTVPLTLFALTKKRPSALQLAAGSICLGGCFLLCGFSAGGSGFEVGNLLCATAGILLGVCVAAVGVFAKGLDLTLYMSVHMPVYFFVSALSALLLHNIPANGAPLESFRFSLSPIVLVLALLFGLLSIGICWLLKTAAILHIDPTAVAITSPLSAVISALVSVLLGRDVADLRLFLGGGLILLAVFLSGRQTPDAEGLPPPPTDQDLHA